MAALKAHNLSKMTNASLVGANEGNLPVLSMAAASSQIRPGVRSLQSGHSCVDPLRPAQVPSMSRIFMLRTPIHDWDKELCELCCVGHECVSPSNGRNDFSIVQSSGTSQHAVGVANSPQASRQP